MLSIGLAGIPPALFSPVKRISQIATVFACVFTAALQSLAGATLQRLSLDEMIAKSTGIVRGTVTASWSAFTGSIIYTHYKIQVSEQFKGTNSGSVEIMVPGGAVGDLHQSFSGSPLLNQGDEFVFFLWTSKTGITWITGLTQGLFALPAGSPVDASATRQPSRELTLDGTTGRPVKDTVLSLSLSDLRTRVAASVAAQGGAK
jgi:hypothetical protein